MINIPEALWHTTLLVKNRTLFERWLANPEELECPPMFYLSSHSNGKEVILLSKEEIDRLIAAGFRQVKIGLNCIIY